MLNTKSEDPRIRLKLSIVKMINKKSEDQRIREISRRNFYWSLDQFTISDLKLFRSINLGKLKINFVYIEDYCRILQILPWNSRIYYNFDNFCFNPTSESKFFDSNCDNFFLFKIDGIPPLSYFHGLIMRLVLIECH